VIHDPTKALHRVMWALAGLCALCVLLGLTCQAHATRLPNRWERRAVETAIRYCKRGTDPWMLLEVLRVEERAGIPPSMRGIILSTAIGEAACEPRAYNKRENAHGLTQIRPRWWTCSGDLFHPLVSAECWLARVVTLANGKARRRCPRSRWVTAEAWASQGWSHPRWPVDWYCDAITGHMMRLNVWRERWGR